MQFGIRGGSGRRRGRAATKERLEYIARTDPKGWEDDQLRGAFIVGVGGLHGMNLGGIHGPLHPAPLLDLPPGPADGMLSWFWRELKRYRALRNDPVRWAVEREQIEGLGRALYNQRNLATIRDWFVATHPDLGRYTAVQAHEAAQAWEHHQEMKRTRGALKKAVRSFPVKVLRGPWGTWRLREPGTTPLSGVMAVGKMLGHCYQHEWHAQHYGEGGPLAILFGKDGWPKVGVALKPVDRSDTPSRIGPVREDQLQAYEIKGVQNASLDADDPYASAVVTVLRRLVGQKPSAWWGSGLGVLRPVPLEVLLDLDEQDLEGLDGPAAHVIRGLLYGGSDNVKFPWVLTQRSWKLDWDLQGRWPKGGDWPAVAWLKPYRLPPGKDPLIVTITLTAKEDMGWVMDGEDRVWDDVRDAHREIWEALEQVARQRHAGVIELLRDQAPLYEFLRPGPHDRRGPYTLLRSWVDDEQTMVELQIDARRLVRHAKAATRQRKGGSATDYVEADLESLLEEMVTQMEWYQGTDYGVPRFDDFSSAAGHAITWAELAWLDEDERAAEEYLQRHRVRVSKEPLGRSARRTA